MNLLITGSEGQLGSEIRNLSSNFKKFNFFFTDYKSLNICDYGALFKFIEKKKINSIINCAAYTNVDLAENEKELAFEINSNAVLNLVKLSEKFQLRLIHISTDYVFDGKSKSAIKEDKKTKPIGVYGISKLKGEEHILNSKSNSIIIRTSWLYSQYKSNFVKTIIDLSTKKNTINVVSDQIGSPTYARDLAKACLDILFNYPVININGSVYHYSNIGSLSWFTFAKTIVEYIESDCLVYPVKSIDFKTLAERPKYSVLCKNKIQKDFNIIIPKWKDSLVHCINKLCNSN